jgi:hypothetical protein
MTDHTDEHLINQHFTAKQRTKIEPDRAVKQDEA